MSNGKKTIFWKVLTSYAILTLFILALTGSVAYMLIRAYILETNFSDLTNKANSAAQILSRPDGRIRFLTSRGLYQLESICDAQLLYVDSDMVARRIPIKVKQEHKTEIAQINDERDSATYAGGEPEKNGDLRESAILKPNPLMSDAKIPRVSDVLRLLNSADAEKSEASAKSGEQEDAPLERVDLSGTLDEELLRSVMSGEVATDMKTIHFLNSIVIFAGTPIKDYETGNTVAAIILCRPTGEIRSITTKLWLFIVMSGVCALFGATLIACIMSRYFTSPIEKMSRVAERMSGGHYGERCAVQRQDELGRLGSTLDILSQRLLDVIGNLNAEKTKLEKILSSIGEGILAVDAGGSIIHHNSAALELLGISIWDAEISDPEAANVKRELLEMLETSIRTRQSAAMNWKTITSRAIEAVAFPVMDDGEVFGAVCLIKDVTEAQKTEQMRRDFIANISHELRTPLTGIRGMVEPLMDGLMQTDREKEDCYNIIYQETVRLEKLIRDMLDLSRLQSGRAGIELEPMPPTDLLMAVKRRMDEQASSVGVELRVSGEENITVMGNEDRIIQVLIILVDNALSFTPSGGSVTLYVKPVGDMVETGVTDTGCGIEPVDLPYIFERFYKADRSRMRTCGTGLGLSIAKIIVELMGGRIDVRTKPGEGSTFYFTLKKA